ncbi:MAG: hypothetical protein AUI33_07770, partial [Ignavibacteria bacterium 13_1_40CM_2_61_4]
LAQRVAAVTAGYLALVARAARGSADYDLPRLLIEARALDGLPGFAAQLEVYHGTAPLVHATARPLSPTQFDRLRRHAAPRSAGSATLAPLFDRDRWDVVGAVAVWPAGAAWLSWRSALAVLPSLVAGALAAATLGGAPGRSRRAVTWFAAGATVFGLAAYADIRAAARDATDRWLADTRLLVQEAVVRVPELRFSLSALAPIARGTELLPGDSAASAPWRRMVAGTPRAAVAVRLAPGRWAELRVAPDAGEGWLAGWLALTLGLALLGPLAVALAAWGERAAARPQRLRETVAAWGFLAPSALHLGVFSFVPMLFVLYLSVHRWTLVDPARPFVGLANFERVFTDPVVWVSLRNTVLYVLYVPVSMVLSLGAAVALHRQTWAVRLARTVFFLPYVCSVVAIALVWQWLYQPDFGVINYLLSAIGLRPLDWLGSPRTALVAMMIVSVWAQLGYQMTVFLAGLQGVPQAYLDAARVDGASAWQRFRRITLPLLRPVTLFVLVTGVIGAFQAFTYMYVLTDGGPLNATDVIAYRIYQTAWEFLQFGYASALSLLLFVVLFGVTRAQFALLA